MAARGSFTQGTDSGAVNVGSVFAWFIIMVEVGVWSWEWEAGNENKKITTHILLMLQ